MKKSTIILILSLMAFVCQAQTEHMKFMGIPLNGTITQFQSKLQVKGIQHDIAGSKELSMGCRKFQGAFAGEKAEFYVYYDEKSKIVYRAKAVISCISEDICDNKYQELKSLLEEKYPLANTDKGYQGGHESFTLILPDSNLSKSLGFIGLYVHDPEIHYPYERYLHIDYEDMINARAHENNKMDDL